MQVEAMTSTPCSSSSYSVPQAAVTTIFTPPSFCGNYVNSDAFQFSASLLSSCLPGFTSAVDYYDEAYFSPAICPSGYTVDCTRWGAYQGPSIAPGETAVICCPSSFKCVAYHEFGCVSASSILALSVQIRWKSSDLSLFETPPLKNGLPTTSRHSGWNPDSSLTYPYTFSSDCSTVTDLFFPFWEKPSCVLTGYYYSPAICPNGWTAAFTRPVLGDGPPVEADETAMLCCPSGLSRFEAACDTACVVTTITSGTYGLTIDLLEVRDPIQIRWASSDFSVLETHPLTPGLILNSLTTTVNPIVPPTGPYKAGLGLAFLPLVIVCFAATCGSLLFHWKRQYQRKRNSRPAPPSPEAFRPRIFSQAIFMSLIGFILSAVILLELSCYILPHSDSQIRIQDVAITKTIISETTIIQKRTANATSSMVFLDLTCGVTGDYCVSTIPALDRGTTTTIISTYGMTACSLSGYAMVLPSCSETVNAPMASAWLSSEQGVNRTIKVEGSVDGAFFLGSMFPTLLAALFSIPWKVMHLHATSLEPFHQLAKSTTSTVATTILSSYEDFQAIQSPITFLTTCLVYSSAITTALASEAWDLGFLDNCTANDNKDCVPIIQVAPKVVHTMQAVLLLIALLNIALAFVSRRWTTGVFADPRSILGIATLIQSFELRSIFTSLDMKSPIKDMKQQVGDIQLHLGSDLSNPARPEFGILLSEHVYPTESNDEQMPTHNLDMASWDREKMPIARMGFLLGIFALFLTGLTILIIYYVVTDNDTGFEHFMSSQRFGPRFLFTVCGIVVNFGWVAIFKAVLRLAPYYSMSTLSSRGAEASTSILQPFSTDQYSALVYSLRRGSPLLLFVTLITVLSDLLPLLLANVPFRRTTTWNAHHISSWLSVGVLCLMITAAIGLLGLLILARPNSTLNAELLRKAPLVATLLVLCQSGNFVQSWNGLSTLSTGERNRRVREAVLRYRLVSNLDNQGQYRASIHSVGATE